MVKGFRQAELRIAKPLVQNRPTYFDSETTVKISLFQRAF